MSYAIKYAADAIPFKLDFAPIELHCKACDKNYVFHPRDVHWREDEEPPPPGYHDTV